MSQRLLSVLCYSLCLLAFSYTLTATQYNWYCYLPFADGGSSANQVTGIEPPSWEVMGFQPGSSYPST